MHQGITGVVGTGHQLPWAWGSACSTPISSVTHRNAQMLLPVPDLSCSPALAKEEMGWGVLGNNHWNVHPQGSSCSWPCSALNCLKTACYNIRCSLSADHYTRSKSLRCPKTELTRNKLILKNINPKTDLRWELALWELLKTYYTNLFPTSSNTPEAWVFLAT